MGKNLLEFEKLRVDAGDPSLPQHVGVLIKHHIAAADATAESDTGCLALTPLTASVQNITAGLTSPKTARNVKVDASSAITTNVTVHGTRGSKAISETIALTGTTAKAGALAFDTITKVVLPIQTTTPVKQKGTVAVSAATAAGTATLTFTSAATGTAYDISAVLAAGDIATTTTAATRLAAVLNADTKFKAKWKATAAINVVSIEALTAAVQDDTLNLTVKAAGDTGLALGAVDPNGGADGVAPDMVSVGFGKKFGIPVKLGNAALVLVKLFNGSADTGTVTADATDLEKNVIALNGTPDGEKAIDLVIAHF